MCTLRRRDVVLLSALAPLVAVAVYANTLSSGFVWDDPIVLRHQLPAFKNLWDVFFPPPRISEFAYGYYRPLVLGSYFLDRALGGNSPFWFHLSLVVTHALASLLLFLVASRLFQGLPHRHVGAVAAAVFFAAHPVHTEAVAWVAGRADVIACVFFLASLLGFLRHGDASGGWPLAVSVVSFFAALLTKETAIALPVLLVALDVMGVGGRRPPGLTTWKRWIPFLAVVAAYVALRRAAVGNVLGDTGPGGPWLEQAGRGVRAVGFYLEKVVLPVDLNVFVAEVPGGLAVLAASLLAVAAALVFGVRWWRSGHSVASFLVLWFFATMAPALLAAIGPVASTPVAERYLYIPSAAFVTLVSYGLLILVAKARSMGKEQMATSSAGLLIVAVLATYAIGTVQRNRVWANDLSLWRDAAAKTPHHGQPHLHAGIAYEQRGMLADAERHYRLASVVKYQDRGRSLAYSNLGRLVILSGREEEGESYLRKAIEIDPNNFSPYLHLGAFALDLADQARRRGQAVETELLARRARDLLESAIQRNPYHVRAHGLLGRVALFVGDRDAARRHLGEAIRLDPSSAEAREAGKLLATLP